jgi:hypothetical protein
MIKELDLGESVRCFYQLHRQLPRFNNYGCNVCTYDKINNPRCPDYFPSELPPPK